MTGKRIRAYIDGFNLYRGALKGTDHKWLNIAQMCDLIVGQHVDEIIYCTAPLKSRPNDPNIHIRQNFYLRALSSEPRIKIFKGQYHVRKGRGWKIPEAGCACCVTEATNKCKCCKGNTIGIMKSEEKGSDVQLAVQLVKDAYEDNFDTALVISEDTDLRPAISIVLGLKVPKRVLVVNPRNRTNYLVGSENLPLFRSTLVESQFPYEVTDSQGNIVHKPATW